MNKRDVAYSRGTLAGLITALLLFVTLIFLIVIDTPYDYQATPVQKTEDTNDPASLSWKIKAINEEIVKLESERDKLVRLQQELIAEGK